MRQPPRLVVRTMGVTFFTVAVILALVFIAILVDARDRVRAAEIDKLRVGARVFTTFEERRQKDQLIAIAALAENPTLKAALDTYFTERGFGALPADQEAELRRTVAREVEKLAAVTATDVVAVLDSRGLVFARAGSSADRWPVGARVTVAGAELTSALQGVTTLPAGAFRVFGAPIRRGDRDIGALVLATSLDAQYARELAQLSSADIVITIDDAVVARTLGESVTRDLIGSVGEPGRSRTLGGEEYAIETLLSSGTARIYMLSSIDAAAGVATRDALFTLGLIALWGFLLAGMFSWWLAQTLTDPIDRVAGTIETMTAARDFSRTLEPTGQSRELDALAASFNDLMRGLATAESETRSAYLGAIRALATALDARDPYTAGHSERVSATSVVIARQMRLQESDVDVIRLGALLHDIGKIGVADEILQKRGPLTSEEYEQIKRHPALGAHILRHVSFLESHLPIVELHHERPDGRGYPFGLRGDDIPVAARIVHVADAFDAMTSARAYRPSRLPEAALAELRDYAGVEFDTASVDALCEAVSSAPVATGQPQEVAGHRV